MVKSVLQRSLKCLAKCLAKIHFEKNSILKEKMEGNDDCMKKRTISPLPRGMGSMALTKDGTIEYKRVLKLKNGEKTRRTVHGNTQLECMKKMEELEKELNTNNKPKNKQTLVEAMYEWMELKKRPILKEQAYKREIGTIKNQIGTSKIGHYRYQSIKTEEIQALLNDLNDKKYSYSVIKKTYDSLNAFYRYVSVRDKFDNPMLLVEVWKKKNVNAEEKQIAYFSEEDIHKFVWTAGERYKTGKMRYVTGYVLAANLYMGLRVGELLALQWKDVDFEKRSVFVCKTLIEVNNPEFDSANPVKMKELNVKKVIFKVQQSTKKEKNRYVPMNENALELMKLHYDNSTYIEPDDYVISTINGKTSTPKNVSNTIKAIVKRGKLSVQEWNTHILRHTCASLYFKAGVNLLIIAAILGNSVEVLQSTYVHLIEEQLQEAARKQAEQLPSF